MSWTSPSKIDTMSPPISPRGWAVENEPWKLILAITCRNPWSIPRLCHVISATWWDTTPNVNAISFSVAYRK